MEPTEQRFKGYRLIACHGCLDDAARAEVRQLWQGVLAEAEAERRLGEVCLLIRDSAGELIGVTTAYRAPFRRHDEIYWFLRMYLVPEHRGTFGLGRRASSWSRDLLLQQAVAEDAAEGVLMVTENPKLWRPGMHRLFYQEGWRFFGRGPRGNEIWYRRRDGGLLSAGPPVTADPA